MSATAVYENALDTARAGARVVGERLPLDRLADLDWSDTPLSDVPLPDLDDVIDDVGQAVRRYPLATVAIVAVSVVATCGILWFVVKRRNRGADEQRERSLAGVA